MGSDFALFLLNFGVSAFNLDILRTLVDDGEVRNVLSESLCSWSFSVLVLFLLRCVLLNFYKQVLILDLWVMVVRRLPGTWSFVELGLVGG
jgi:hypothetical protein